MCSEARNLVILESPEGISSIQYGCKKILIFVYYEDIVQTIPFHVLGQNKSTVYWTSERTPHTEMSTEAWLRECALYT